MAKYRISGVWKNANNVITAFAFHIISETSVGRSVDELIQDIITIK